MANPSYRYVLGAHSRVTYSKTIPLLSLQKARQAVGAMPLKAIGDRNFEVYQYCNIWNTPKYIYFYVFLQAVRAL